MRTFSYGGGVQSTAALVLAVQKKIDFSIFLFANVGADSENPATLEYINQYAIPFALANDINLHTLERKRKDGTTETLYQRLTKPGSRSLPIPVRMSNGAPGTRSCTADFKIRVIAKWQKERGATLNQPAITGIGISVDEWERARTDSGIPHQTLEYPLLDLNLSRQDCINIITKAGLPLPPKSSCYFCPFHSLEEWRKIKKEQPDLFDKAVELEILLNQRRETLGKDAIRFHRSLKPLSHIVNDHQLSLFDDSSESCVTFCNN